MKIFFIGQKGIPAISGGVEKHVEELSTRLVAAGHEVYVYTRPNYTSKDLKEYDGVKLISLPSIATKHLDAITHAFFACLDVVFKRKVDLIHFHSIGPSSLIWLIKLLKPRTPVVATFHTQCYYHKKWGIFARLYLKFGEFVCCRLAEKVITVSKVLKNYVKEKYDKETNYIPNGVPVAGILPADEIDKKWGLKKGSYILAVSRLVRHKGVHYLIDAYKQITTDKKLVIVGDGSFTENYVEELKAMAADNPNIIFTGRQFGKTLAELFSNAYLFIQPSESEGLSIALLEAMSYGRAVLVSDIPENKEVIEDVGFTFKNKDSQSLAKKLEYLLEYYEIIENRKAASIALVKEKYNWDKIVENIVWLYGNPLYNKEKRDYINWSQLIYKNNK